MNDRFSSFKQPLTTEVTSRFLTSMPRSITIEANDIIDAFFRSNLTIGKDSLPKTLVIDLNKFPVANWNVSFQTNKSIHLDIILPMLFDSIRSNTVTNLTIKHIQANNFVTTLTGPIVNLYGGDIETRQFSLLFNLSNNQTLDKSSEVIIGHVKTETFQLNITRSNRMNISIEQVDSDMAELFVDDQFCNGANDIDISLNLSMNGNYSLLGMIIRTFVSIPILLRRKYPLRFTFVNAYWTCVHSSSSS